ncbi:MAG: hypothetical protein JNM67_07335 [Bacteroidetes bacterium]|nr:hypothetical protein [Bacteroidota bacterium]
MIKKEPSINILSPDGITIRMENFYTREEAKEYFDQWLKRFEKQGYYSSNYGRIALELVWDCCEYIEF